MKFRESFRGYNKDDVNSYIEQMNIKFSRREAELLELLKNIPQPETAPESTENGSLSSENESLRETVSRLEAELRSAKEDNDKLASELDSLKAEAGDAESDEVTSERLGNILLIANENAEKIVREAKAEASRIISEANLKASSIEYEVAVEKKRTTEEFGKCITALSKEYLAECTEIVAETSVRINESAERLKAEAEKLSAV